MGHLSPLRVLTSSLGQVARHPLVFLRTQGVFCAASALLGLAASVFLLGSFVPAIVGVTLGGMPPPGALQAVGYVAAAILAGLLWTVGQGMGLVAADALREGERLGAGAAWTRLRPRLGALVRTEFAMGALLLAVVFFGTLGAFAFPPLLWVALAGTAYLSLRWALAPAASVLAARGALDSLDRSMTLTRRAHLATLAASLPAAALLVLPGVVCAALLHPERLGLEGLLPALVLTPAGEIGAWAGVELASLAGAFLLSAAMAGLRHALDSQADEAARREGVDLARPSDDTAG